MKRTVNSTGRKKIPKKCMDIEVFDGSPRNFKASIDLSTMRMPSEAKVFLDAKCPGSPIVKRFDFGVVDNIAPAEDCSLVGIEGYNVTFDLKVIDKTERIGRILGIAKDIRPNKSGKQTATGRKGLLPIDVGHDLGQELWKLDFGVDVTLLVNSEVSGLKDRVFGDPLFCAMVLPVIVRIILTKALELGEALDDEGEAFDEETPWHTLWLHFGTQLHSENKKSPENDEDSTDKEEWIDDVVARFAADNKLKDKFVKSLSTLEGDEG